MERLNFAAPGSAAVTGKGEIQGVAGLQAAAHGLVPGNANSSRDVRTQIQAVLQGKSPLARWWRELRPAPGIGWKKLSSGYHSIIYLGIDHGYFNIRVQVIAVNAKLLQRISPGPVYVGHGPG